MELEEAAGFQTPVDVVLDVGGRSAEAGLAFSWRVDTIGCIVWLSREAALVYGRPADELVGKPITVLSEEAQSAQDVGRLARLLAEGRCAPYETTHRRRDGGEVRLLFEGVIEYDGSGRVAGAQGRARVLD